MKKYTRDDLDNLGIQWLQSKNDRTRELVVYEIWEAISNIDSEITDPDSDISKPYSDQYTDFAVDFITKELPKFTLEKGEGKLSNYYFSIRSRRKPDLQRGEYQTRRISTRRKDLPEDDPRHIAEGPEAEEKISATVPLAEHLDKDTEVSLTRGQIDAGPKDFIPPEWNFRMLMLIECMLDRQNSATENQSTKFGYWRTFFTQDISFCLRTFEISEADTKDAREPETLQVMKTGYLDFTLDRICRCYREIQESHMKLYGAIVKGKPMVLVDEDDDQHRSEHNKLRFSNDIYEAYFDRIEHLYNDKNTKNHLVLISQNLAPYKKLKHDIVNRPREALSEEAYRKFYPSES